MNGHVTAFNVLRLSVTVIKEFSGSLITILGMGTQMAGGYTGTGPGFWRVLKRVPVPVPRPKTRAKPAGFGVPVQYTTCDQCAKSNGGARSSMVGRDRSECGQQSTKSGLVA